MTRADLQELARLRLSEAHSLLAAGYPSGAYYLAGYCVECALKACIAKNYRGETFPTKLERREVYVHDLVQLARYANVHGNLILDQKVYRNWLIVENWSEKDRYDTWQTADAQSLIDSISEPVSGVLQWLVRQW